MTEEKYIINNVIEHKTKLYIIARKLKDAVVELDYLSEEDKKIGIERAEQKDCLSLKSLYNALNGYMGWDIYNGR